MTVTELTNEACGAGLQGSVRQATSELASMEAGCKVHWIFRPSMVNLATGMHGVWPFIAETLTRAGAVVRPAQVTNGEVVGEAETGLTTDEIISAIRQANGADKYPDATIRQNLSVVLRRRGQVAARRMTTTEDCNRDCKPTRLRWYWVQE